MSTYDDIAECYDTWVGTHSMCEDPFFPAVEAFIGEVAGQRICNLACGQGRMARHLADLGVRVVGIDLSVKLLAIARRMRRPSHVGSSISRPTPAASPSRRSAVHENRGGEQNFVQSIE
jgi:ubiquinone/menaquinone biosynthesis C-methylase UbiE